MFGFLPRPDDVECGALVEGFTFPDQELPPDEPDPEVLCGVCFECAAEIGECKLVDDDDDDNDDDEACTAP